MQPYRMPSPARRRWGPAGGAAPPSPPPSPGTTTVDVKVVSPAGSPCAAPPVWTRPPIVGSPHSPQLSRRSHDGRGAWSPGYAASVGSDSDTGAAADDLLDFLADLKNKYGLAQPRPAQPAPGQQQVNVRVQVQQGCAGHAAPCAQQLAVQHPQLLLPALHLQHGHGHAAQPGSPGWQYGQQYEQTTFSAAGSGSGADARGSSPGSTSGEPLAAAAAEQAAASADTAAQLAGDLQQHQQEQQQQQQQQGGTLDSHMEVELAMLEEAQLAMEEAQRNAVAAAAGEQHATPQPAGRQQQDGATSAAGHGDGTHSAASGREWLVPPPRGRRLPWGSLHTLLVRRGFPGLFATEEEAMAADYTELEPDIVTCFDVIHSLLEDQTRVAAHHRRLSESISAAQRREAAIVHSFTTAAKRRAAETNKWKRLTIDNQIAAVVAAKRLEGEVNQLTHELRGKEAELERMRNMLRVQAERDERRAQADREAYDRVKRAHAASKVADTPNAAEAAVRMAARDMRPIDICRLFEAERANLAEAAAAVAADAAAARAQLEIAQEALHAAGLPCERFEEIEGQARSAARAVAAAEERARAAAEAVAMLQLEVAARPTQAQYDSLKRQATIMERQLAKAAAERKAAEEDKGTIKSVHPKTKQLSTRDMMLRDRNMQRLGLQAVEEMPKPVLVEVVQDACALLECSTPLELCAAIKPVQDLAALVPRMERFIGDVCGAVFQAGLAHVPEALRQDNPADVPAILGAWVSELGELVETRGVLRALLRQLASRVSLQPNDPAPTASEVVPLVHQLVELERKVYHSREVLEAAETALAAQPDILINRICLQFQRLFGCKSLQGILPAMNKLYLAHTEAQTFLSSLRVALGLEPGATLEACANRMQQLLEAKRAELGSLLPAKEPPGAAPVLPRSAEAVVVEVAPRRRTSGHGPHGELQAAGQVAVERMAARRHWPQVEIYVPAADPEAADGPAAAAQPAAAARQSPEASAPVPPMALSVQG
ncbi:hypothetical protein C2E20_5039 [Micractinium conductrix]|uniref:Centrosomal protein of 70 kDa n=1 Tax=Micractinium conductrix TaxID=554055 RepID=A0A2P6VBJ0_9CHLO|nr:hypothetical protein C2E20_5039 [Micractinium conductrix]|eukprot:PSC71462.1 hypothetical protein C2E20_5039 [Micractinium conductrix]